MAGAKDRLRYLVLIAKTNGTSLACVYCGATNTRWLHGGHKNNDGAAHYRELCRELGIDEPMRDNTNKKKLPSSFQGLMQKLKFPAEHLARLQIECANHNEEKRTCLRHVSQEWIDKTIKELWNDC